MTDSLLSEKVRDKKRNFLVYLVDTKQQMMNFQRKGIFDLLRFNNTSLHIYFTRTLGM